MLTQYWSEFLTVALLHLLAVASPGPDLAVVIRQSLCRTRAEAIMTSVGIGSGILIHVTYSLLGLGLIISHSLVAFSILKTVAVIYLLYVAWHCFKAAPHSQQEPQAQGQDAQQSQTGLTLSRKGYFSAFRLGFLTNALNPKATLFFVALFAAVISPQTPHMVQAAYGIWMAIATAIWFTGVSLFLSHHKVRAGFARFGHWVERVMGVALLALAGKLASATLEK